MKQKNEANQLTKDSIIAFLRKNKPYLEKEFGVTKIALYGSYVRGEQTPKSDIDLIIEVSKPSLKDRCKLKRFLEDHFKRKVDISYFSGMRSFIRSEIEEELVYA